MPSKTTITTYLLAASLSLPSLMALPLANASSSHLKARAVNDNFVNMYTQLERAIRYVQFELADSAGSSKGAYVLDIQDCGTLGYPKSKDLRMMRPGAGVDANARRRCQTFLLQPMLHEPPNRFGIHAPDTSSHRGVRITDGNRLELIYTDPLFYPDQRFQISCDKPNEQNKDRLFGQDCFIAAEGDNCLRIDDYVKDSDASTYSVKFQKGGCTRDPKVLFNLVDRSKCFTPTNHLVNVEDGQPYPDPPQGC